MPVKKGGLGRGLDSLFDDNGLNEGAVVLPIMEVEPNREQPRQDFDESSLAELSNSIAEHGVLQPILVRPMPGGAYQIIAGERRWRAARAAGLSEIPVVIRELGDEETMVAALIENLQREDLNPMEEAKGYQSLMEEYNLTQDEVARRLGKSRSVVANALRLLKLPGAVQELVRDQAITQGHARALMALENGGDITPIALEIADKALNVRECEQLVKQRNEAMKIPVEQKSKSELIDIIFPGEARTQTFYEEVQLSISEALGRKVKVLTKGGNKGQLVVDFYSREELKQMAEALCGKE